MDKNLSVDIYPKSTTGKIAGFLWHSEFKCRCLHEDCTFHMINHRVVAAFNLVRKHWGSSIGVTSGFRCQRHNKVVGGVVDSWHKKGSAIDIFPHYGDIEELYHLANKFFDLVIHYKDEGFLHCQMEE